MIRESIIGAILLCLLFLLACDDRIPSGNWVETTLADFADGRFDERGNLFAAADGSVRVAYSPDLNGDGWADIIFSNYGTIADNPVRGDIFIYWGGAGGFSPENRDVLPLASSAAVSLGDLNADGFLDIVANGAVEKEKSGKSFTVFLGAAGGYSIDSRREFPLFSAFGSTIADFDKSGFPDVAISGSPDENTRGISVFFDPFGAAPRSVFVPIRGVGFLEAADLDGDSRLDIVATVFNDGNSARTNSYIIWNGEGTFSIDNITPIPAYGGHGATVADLNNDGHLDLIVNNFGNFEDEYILPSYIYWGSRGGLDMGRHTELVTMGACESSAADLNRDGFLDIVFCNWAGDEGLEGPPVPSVIYWGAAAGFSQDNRAELPCFNGIGGSVLDYNKDGYLDILINNMGGTRSFIYWGGEGDYSAERRSELESYEAFPTNMRDFGNICDRQPRDIYLSSIYESGFDAKWVRVTWEATAKLGDSVELELRVGSVPMVGEGWSDWMALENGKQIESPLAGRFAQYRAIFHYGNFSMPALEEVRIEYSR